MKFGRKWLNEDWEVIINRHKNGTPPQKKNMLQEQEKEFHQFHLKMSSKNPSKKFPITIQLRLRLSRVKTGEYDPK